MCVRCVLAAADVEDFDFVSVWYVAIVAGNEPHQWLGRPNGLAGSGEVEWPVQLRDPYGFGGNCASPFSTISWYCAQFTMRAPATDCLMSIGLSTRGGARRLGSLRLR